MIITRIFKSVWFISLVATLAVFLYVYASLPEEIQVLDGTVIFSVSRNGVFYSVLSLLVVFAALALTFSKLFGDRSPFLASWFYGLVICFHIFIVVALQFLNLYSSSEKFDYSRIGYIIYGSLTLVALWILAGPIYYFSSRLFSKPAI